MQQDVNTSTAKMTEDIDGIKRWHRNGQMHRDDGPAIETPGGYKAWYRNGQVHRDDGPAVEYPDGGKVWYRNGLAHRDDGPAIENTDGTKEWWKHGELIARFTAQQVADKITAHQEAMEFEKKRAFQQASSRAFQKGYPKAISAPPTARFKKRTP